MRGKTNSVTTSGGGSSENTLKNLLDVTKSSAFLFSGYSGSSATSVEGLISYNDTENVTYMRAMFSGCSNLLSVPLINTSKVTSMYQMFNYCNNLVSIPLFDTSKVTDMTSMFEYASKLTNIPLLNTSNVTTMSSMFRNASSLTTIPLLNTSKVTNMNYMFQSCPSLIEVPSLDVSNVNGFSYTFSGCSKLTAIHMVGMKSSFNIASSTLFTTEALHEIITNLATVTSTKTLTMGSTNLAKVSEEYKTISTNKGWTLA